MSAYSLHKKKRNPNIKYYQYYQINPNFKIQNLKIWIWDFGFILDLVVFGFWIYPLG